MELSQTIKKLFYNSQHVHSLTPNKSSPCDSIRETKIKSVEGSEMEINENKDISPNDNNRRFLSDFRDRQTINCVNFTKRQFLAIIIALYLSAKNYRAITQFSGYYCGIRKVFHCPHAVQNPEFQERKRNETCKRFKQQKLASSFNLARQIEQTKRHRSNWENYDCNCNCILSKHRNLLANIEHFNKQLDLLCNPVFVKCYLKHGCWSKFLIAR